jgi:hypothetical protein
VKDPALAAVYHMKLSGTVKEVLALKGGNVNLLYGSAR